MKVLIAAAVPNFWGAKINRKEQREALKALKLRNWKMLSGEDGLYLQSNAPSSEVLPDLRTKLRAQGFKFDPARFGLTMAVKGKGIGFLLTGLRPERKPQLHLVRLDGSTGRKLLQNLWKATSGIKKIEEHDSFRIPLKENDSTVAKIIERLIKAGVPFLSTTIPVNKEVGIKVGNDVVWAFRLANSFIISVN